MVTDRRSSSVGRSVIVPVVIWLFAVALAAVQAFLTFGLNWRGVPEAFQPNSSSAAGLVAILAMCSVGSLIAARHPGNRIGWLLVAIAISASFLDIPRLYAGQAIYAHRGWPVALELYWLNQIVWVLVFAELLVLLPLWFPTGRLLSRRWSLVIALDVIPVLIVVVASFDPLATDPLHNPFGIRALTGFSNALNGAVFSIVMLATYVLAISSLVVRYRRGGEQERQQLKWLLVGVGLLLVSLATTLLIPALQNTPIIA